MDAEIRRLTYVPRFAKSNQRDPDPSRIEALMSGVPARFKKENAAKYPGQPALDVRLESRVIELERERTEDDRRHREALAAERQRAAEELSVTLSEQKQTLELQFAGSIRSAIVAFEESKREYFARADASIVRLALAVAARVLNREAQLDPLLLRGPVRVALEEVQQSATCVLEVAADQAPLWTNWLAADNLTAVEVRAKNDASRGYCRLEVGASSADLSVHTQLAEIERGFFDFLQSRSASRDSESGK